MGYVTCLFTSNSTQLNQRSEYPDVHMMIYCNLNNTERIKEKISSLKQLPLTICAIVSFVDPWCSLAAQLSAEYGLSSFSAAGMKLMENKLKTRDTLINTIHNPKYYAVSARNQRWPYHQAKKKMPAVVKYVWR